jgi:hypothetical protein
MGELKEKEKEDSDKDSEADDEGDLPSKHITFLTEAAKETEKVGALPLAHFSRIYSCSL